MSNFLEVLTNVLDDWRFTNSTDPFLQRKFHHLVNQHPQKTLNTIFFELYLKHPAINRFSSLRRFFVSQCDHVYSGFSDYALILQNTMRKEILADNASIINREARFITKEILALAINNRKTPARSRSRLINNLHLLITNPCFEKTLPETLEELLGNLPGYLEKADLLAELPDFSGVYFTASEIAPLWNALSRYTLTSEDEKKLELFLNLPRKKQILFTLSNFIRRCPDSTFVKKACAVYISLGEIIPWTKHPFIRRLLAVSYQEALALMSSIK